MSQYTKTSKYNIYIHGLVKCTHQLIFKKKLKIFPQEAMPASQNRFAPELNEKEVIELLENATSGSIKKATKYGVKIFQGKNLKTFFLTG